MAAAITYRIAFGPRAGQKVLTLRGAMPRQTTARPPLCDDIDGFSLHAAVRVESHDGMQAQAATEAAVATKCEVETIEALPHRISWARLLR